MKRPKWKLPYIHSVFFKKRFLFKNYANNLRLRGSTIPFSFLGKRVKIYNGIWFLTKDVTSAMIGYKFGQFSFTKKIERLHIKKKLKKKSKKK